MRGCLHIHFLFPSPCWIYISWCTVYFCCTTIRKLTICERKRIYLSYYNDGHRHTYIYTYEIYYYTRSGFIDAFEFHEPLLDFNYFYASEKRVREMEERSMVAHFVWILATFSHSLYADNNFVLLVISYFQLLRFFY